MPFPGARDGGTSSLPIALKQWINACALKDFADASIRLSFASAIARAQENGNIRAEIWLCVDRRTPDAGTFIDVIAGQRNRDADPSSQTGTSLPQLLELRSSICILRSD